MNLIDNDGNEAQADDKQEMIFQLSEAIKSGK